MYVVFIRSTEINGFKRKCCEKVYAGQKYQKQLELIIKSNLNAKTSYAAKTKAAEFLKQHSICYTKRSKRLLQAHIIPFNSSRYL